MDGLFDLYKEDEIVALPFNETIEILLVGLLR